MSEHDDFHEATRKPLLDAWLSGAFTWNCPTTLKLQEEKPEVFKRDKQTLDALYFKLTKLYG